MSFLPKILTSLGLVGCLLCSIPETWAGQAKNPPAATCESVNGILLTGGAGQAWTSLQEKDAMAGDANLIALFDARILSGNEAVEVRLLGDIGQFGPLPALESMVSIHANPKVDMDLTLERGIVVLTNRKKAGPARVNLVLRGHLLGVTLQSPETTLAVEIYGRHAPGLHRIKEDNPATFLIGLVGKGKVLFDNGKATMTLSAPPGQAMVKWDSIVGQPEFLHLEEIPKELQRDEKEKKLFQKICLLAGQLKNQEIGPVLDRMLRSQDGLERQVAVTAMGALDDLPRLLATLGDANHADVRQQGILVLRQWLGRGPGQVKKIQDILLGQKKLSEAQANSVLQLLFGFDQAEKTQPDTYELLLAYLEHSKLPVRELAYWHLVRLVPAGKAFGYDPAGPEAQRTQALARWQALIPPGKLPSAEK